jgi:hypothetical protein
LTEQDVSSISANNKASIAFIGLSFLASVLYSYLLSHTERGLPLFDWFNIAIHIIWFGLLAWIAWDVHRGKPGAKGTLLFLALLVLLLTGFDLFEEGSLLLAAVSFVEALFLFAAYWSFPKIDASLVCQ